MKIYVVEFQRLLWKVRGHASGQQLERIREMGCDEAQGYLLSRPVTADKVADQLKSLSSDVSRTSLWRRVG